MKKIIAYVQFLALSIVTELFFWIVAGGGSIGYKPYPYVYDLQSWSIKHLAVALCFTLVSFIHSEKWHTKTWKAFLGVVAFLCVRTLPIGHNGDPYCGTECSDFEGFAYVVFIPLFTLILFLVLFALLRAKEKVHGTAQNIFFACTSVASVALIALAVTQALYVDSFFKNYPLTRSEIEFSFSTLEYKFRETLKKYSADQWFHFCDQFRYSSANMKLLGSSYASTCYYIGAVGYHRQEFCRYSYRESQCIADVSEKRPSEEELLAPKPVMLFNDYYPSIKDAQTMSADLNFPYHPTLIISNGRTNQTYSLSGSSLYLNDIFVTSIPRIDVAANASKKVLIDVNFKDVVCAALKAQKRPGPYGGYAFSIKVGSKNVYTTQNVNVDLLTEWKKVIQCT